MVAVVFSASVIVFLLMQVLGDPVRAMLPLGTPPAQIARVRQALGYDAPLVTRYVRFLHHALTGDFGQSLWLRTPAFPTALHALPYTLLLVLPAMVIGSVLGVAVGMLAGIRPG